MKTCDVAVAFKELLNQEVPADSDNSDLLGKLNEQERTNRSIKRLQIRKLAAKLRLGGTAIEKVELRSPRQLAATCFQTRRRGRRCKEPVSCCRKISSQVAQQREAA